MKKLWMFVLLLNAFFLANVSAKEEAAGRAAGDSIKKAANSVGGGMEKAGKTVAPEINKAGNWFGNILQGGGKKLDKASK